MHFDWTRETDNSNSDYTPVMAPTTANLPPSSYSILHADLITGTLANNSCMHACTRPQAEILASGYGMNTVLGWLFRPDVSNQYN